MWINLAIFGDAFGFGVFGKHNIIYITFQHNLQKFLICRKSLANPANLAYSLFKKNILIDLDASYCGMR